MTSEVIAAQQQRFFNPMAAYLPQSPVGRQQQDPSLNGQLMPNKFFIGGLAAETTEVDLRAQLTSALNEKVRDFVIKEVKVITDRSLNASKSGEPRRYAFVEMEHSKDPSKVSDLVEEIVNILGREHSQGRPLEIHGRVLNIGKAYKKTNTMDLRFGPAAQAGFVDPMTDPVALQLQAQMFQRSLMMHNAYAAHGLMFPPFSPNAMYVPSSPTSPMTSMPAALPMQYGQPAVSVPATQAPNVAPAAGQQRTYYANGQMAQAQGMSQDPRNMQYGGQQMMDGRFMGNGMTAAPPGAQSRGMHQQEDYMYRTGQGFCSGSDMQSHMRAHGH